MRAAQALEILAFDKGPLQPYLEGHDRDRLADLDAYVAYPATLDRRFDFIFVDGRKRRRCLIEAAQLLKPNGAVVLTMHTAATISARLRITAPNACWEKSCGLAHSTIPTFWNGLASLI